MMDTTISAKLRTALETMQEPEETHIIQKNS